MKCEWCEGDIRPGCRRDAKTCSKKCRQAKHRFRVGVGPRATTAPMLFAYADPPYPGLAKRYYGPGAQEVNHRVLIGHLEEYYQAGWALSTSADALAEVLALCPPGARVCAWVRGSRSSVSYRPRTAWEPLIVVGGRSREYSVTETCDDTLIWGGRQHSHPGALVGMKSAAFSEWMFRMLGAKAGDSLVDLFPGSGSVSRAWNLYTSNAAARDTLLERDATSRLVEAQNRLVEKLDRCRDGTGETCNLEAFATPQDLSPKYSSTPCPVCEVVDASGTVVTITARGPTIYECGFCDHKREI